MSSRWLRFTLLSLLLASAAAAEPALVAVSGKVEIGRGIPPVWRVASLGDAVAPGDSVRTGPGARAEISLGDGRVVRVYERSVLRVGTGVTPTGALRTVDLDEGRSLFDVMRQAVADEFEVHTPEIIVSVKGTRFLVAAVEGLDYTSVFRGEVALAGPGFEAVSVRPGMTGAQGELYLTRFDDPWEAWQTGASAPAPQLEQDREQEVDDAIRAAAGGADAESDASPRPGLLATLRGGVLGSASDERGADDGAADDGAAAAASPERVSSVVGGAGESVPAVTEPVAGAADALVGGATDLVGDAVAPVTEPVGGLLAPVTDPVGDLAVAVTDPVGDLLAPVTDPVGDLTVAVTDPVGDLLAPVEDPVGDLTVAVTDPVGDLLAPVTDPVGGLLAPVSDPVGDVLAPVTDPVGGLLAPVTDPVTAPLGGLLGGARSR
jgi:hypothetical protein